MKQKLFTRPLTVVMPDEMFEHIKTITDQENISFSDYIRQAIEEKFENEKNDFRRN